MNDSEKTKEQLIAELEALRTQQWESAQTEETLLKLGRAVEQSLDGIAICAMDGTVQFVNPAWAEMHGYAVEEVRGKHVSFFHTPEHMRKEVEPFLKLIRKRGDYQGEVRHVKKDGSILPTWMTGKLLRDKRGKSIGMLGIARDISERIRLEETQEELEVQLRQSKEKERTHHVSDENVREVSSLLAEAASHLDLAKQKLPEELRSLLTQAVETMDRAIQLTNLPPSDEE